MAPFNTEILSISSGLMSAAPEEYENCVLLLELSRTGSPSTTQSGVLLPLKEFRPRSTIRVGPPTPLPDCDICTPATLPCSRFETLVERFSEKTSVFTSCMAYPNAFFSRLIPNAVTTTSESISLSSFNVMEKLVFLLILISCFSYPMNEIISLPFSGASNLKAPSMSVIVPRVVPSTETLAPIMDSPFTSFPVPVMVLRCSCAKATKQMKDIIVTKSNLMCFFIRLCF